jgi:hypothetical protein
MKKKVFYMTKEFIQKELQIEKVETSQMPIGVINNIPVSARMFKWNSLEEMKIDDIFMNIKAMNGIVYFYEMNPKDFQKFCKEVYSEFENVNIEEDENFPEYVENFEEADEFQIRMFVF